MSQNPSPDKMAEEICEDAPIVLTPVGHVISEFTAPIPGGGSRERVKNLICDIVIAPDLLELLDGIDGFSHILVLFWPDRISPEDRKRTRVHPRGRKDLPLKGVFATCTPTRPNPVLVTVVRLLERNGNILRVQGLDALDGSPVLDIKPYSPGFHQVADPEFPEWMNRLYDGTR